MIQTNSPVFWRGTFALVIGSFMVFANVYVTQPLLPMLANAFSISPLQASGSFTITTFTLGLSLLIYGPLSDALGRRGLMLLTLLGTTLTTFCLSFVANYEMLLALRGIQGFFLAGLPAIAVAYLSDEYAPDALLIAVGLYISGNSIGGIGGRLIGGFFGEWIGPFATFGLMSVISAVCLLCVFYLLPPSKHFQPKTLNVKSIKGDIAAHLKNRRLLTCYLIGGFSFFIFINQYSYITFVLEQAPYSLSAKYVGLLFLTYLAGTLGSALSGKLATRFTQPSIMIMGTSIFIIGSLVTLGDSLLAIILGLLTNSFGFFVCHSTCSAFVSRNADKAKASASSLYLVFYYLGASLGGFYLDPFWHYGGWNAIIVGSWIILGAVLTLEIHLLRQHNRKAIISKCPSN
ncbi:MFS transporter [Marinomonas mediterranea]|uniref:Major facilitator superfamily MFS_1 n=1 Tax=Marinomonas mediterranea (strain ATCC 700492 / JCM 21426 / NBRC 103028 / MMB-1) TaxID=717774 RepID=F2JXE6_MARM1|nr:MFS transporter [Marinomonas mediterranea]ADZ91846.1 major facilitator superfamily MFS_1 [Marinomonas mediterranea MMB-1]WCN09799.1 MFS transporter [Marinomonas mediterranea]WCN13882.1 MFS transporter [Marinomonas mediterranea]WCN17938.1 MFS transporter [Marinomonas mediterranea MMB-1]